jgi:hypothetical protein
MFVSAGAPEIPIGGSLCIFLKSRSNRFRAGFCPELAPLMTVGSNQSGQLRLFINRFFQRLACFSTYPRRGNGALESVAAFYTMYTAFLAVL